jgi:hypothetical protein
VTLPAHEQQYTTVNRHAGREQAGGSCKIAFTLIQHFDGKAQIFTMVKFQF